MWGYRTCRVAGVRALRALRALVRPSHPHVGLLFRAWATPPTYGTGGPRAGEGVQPYTRLAAMRASPLCGAWAFSSARGPAIPSLGNPARVRDRRPACGIGGPRAKEGVQPYTRLAAMRASSLCGAWAFSSARGPAVPSLGNPAHVRDRRPACGIGGPRAGHVGVQVVLSRCPWAAARPRDRHTRACGSEWSISKPGQALPPPPGTDSVPWHQFRPGRQAVAVFDRCGITK